MALYRLISFLSIFSLVLGAPILLNSTFPEATMSPSFTSLSPIPALSTETPAAMHQVLPLSPPPMFILDEPSGDSRTRNLESEPASVVPVEVVIPPSGEDLSAVGTPAKPEVAIETGFRHQTKHTNKGFWFDLFCTITGSQPSSSTSSIIDKHDSPAPSLPQLDLGPKFDGKDITDSLFSEFSKRHISGEAPRTDSPVETRIIHLTHQPGSNPGGKGLLSDIVPGHNPSTTPPPSVGSTHTNSRSRPKSVTATPGLPRLDLSPALNTEEVAAIYEQFSNLWAKRGLKGEGTGPAAVVAPHASVRLHPQPLVGLSLATIAKLHRDIHFTNPFSKSSHRTAAVVGTPYSASASAYNRLISQRELVALQNEVPKGWGLKRVAFFAKISNMVMLCFLSVSAVAMMFCYGGFRSARWQGTKRTEVLPRFSGKVM